VGEGQRTEQSQGFEDQSVVAGLSLEDPKEFEYEIALGFTDVTSGSG
jgi:hypothetical protein